MRNFCAKLRSPSALLSRFWERRSWFAPLPAARGKKELARTSRSGSGKESAHFLRSCVVGEREIEEIVEETAQENRARGVPYPGYFAKCTEVVDCKRVRGTWCLKVCAKCAEDDETKGFESDCLQFLVKKWGRGDSAGDAEKQAGKDVSDEDGIGAGLR
jgi:hypothetical protein